MILPKFHTADNVEHIAESREAYFDERLRNAENAKTDTKRDRRIAMRECKWCFYFGHMMAGQAFTEYTCAGCGERKMHSNTAVPKLCEECADRLDACRCCGGAREWKRDAPRPTTKLSKPRRKHSREGRVRCDICSPLRCSKAK